MPPGRSRGLDDRSTEASPTEAETLPAEAGHARGVDSYPPRGVWDGKRHVTLERGVEVEMFIREPFEQRGVVAQRPPLRRGSRDDRVEHELGLRAARSGEASGEDSDDDGFEPATSATAFDASDAPSRTNLAVGSEPG